MNYKKIYLNIKGILEITFIIETYENHTLVFCRFIYVQKTRVWCINIKNINIKEYNSIKVIFWDIMSFISIKQDIFWI